MNKKCEKMNIIGFGNRGTDFEDVKCSCTKYSNLNTKPDAFFVLKQLIIEIMKKIGNIAEKNCRVFKKNHEKVKKEKKRKE